MWVVVRADRVEDYDRTSAPAGRSLMRVLIVGGGKVGTFIAGAPAGHEVVIMESQAGHAEIAARR